jgi:hypothetical protein
MEDEFVEFSAAVQEANLLRRFLNYLGLCENETDLVLVHSDSQTSIAYTKYSKYHSKTKHIDTKYNFIRDMVAKKQVCMHYISTHKMVVDPFTNAILRDVFIGHVISLGLRRL